MRPKQVSIFLKVWRVKKAMRQGELSKRAGISHAALSQIESGKVVPRTETLIKLAIAMDLQFGKMLQMIEEVDDGQDTRTVS